jgi:hypothetical protein
MPVILVLLSVLATVGLATLVLRRRGKQAARSLRYAEVDATRSPRDVS